MTPAEQIREVCEDVNVGESVGSILERFNALADHLESAPSGGLREWALKHESVWLIEDPKNHPQRYWLPNLRTGTDWTYDVHQAVRFARHNDANAVIAARPNIDELWIAVQHAWDDPELDAILAATLKPPESADRPEPTFDKWPDGQFTTVMERQAFSMGWDARGAEPGSEGVKK